MRFDLKQPCDDCPFLKSGGIRLSQARIREIAEAMLDSQGSTFVCHKTVDYDHYEYDEDNPYVPQPGSYHCAGALIFAELHGNATQAMRIAERLHLYDAKRLMADERVTEKVFPGLTSMLEASFAVIGE